MLGSRKPDDVNIRMYRSTIVLIFLGIACCWGCNSAKSTTELDGMAVKAIYKDEVEAAKKLGVGVQTDSEGEVTYLDFYSVLDVPAAVVYVDKFPNLKMLNFSSTDLADEDLKHVAKAKQLEEIGLHGTQVTDAGLVHLAELKKLRMLNLNDTQIGDAGLEHLAELRNLEQLRLQSTSVTDAGLEHLRPLDKLAHVWLSGSKVTNDGVAQLKQSLPQAEIVNTEIVDTSGEPLLPASAYPQE